MVNDKRKRAIKEWKAKKKVREGRWTSGKS